MKKSPFSPKCHYDYSNKCDCSEDDKCGCTYPNNLSHSYSEDCFEETLNKTNSEKIVFINPQQQENKTSTNHLNEDWKNNIHYHKKSPKHHSTTNN